MIGQIKKVGTDLLFHAITHQNIHDVVALLEDNEVDIYQRADPSPLRGADGERPQAQKLDPRAASRSVLSQGITR
jgi:hypothetical protein